MSFWQGMGAAVATLGSKYIGQGEDRQQAKKGLEYENRYALRKEKKLFDRAMDRGMTPTEYYGSAAPGTPGPGGGVSATLGNQASQKSAMVAQTINAQLGRDVQKRGQDVALEQTKMQTDAAVETAKIQAGATMGAAGTSAEATRYAADIQKRIAENKLQLSTREYNEVTLPAAAAQLNKTKEETKKLINEVVTSTPEFQRSKILLQMGVENTIQTALLQRFGVDITSKKSMAKLSDDQFRNILSVLVAVGSHANREIQGLSSAATSLLRSLNPFTDSKTETQFNLSPIQ